MKNKFKCIIWSFKFRILLFESDGIVNCRQKDGFWYDLKNLTATIKHANCSIIV